MSTTEQRTGFRLPWSTEDRPPGSATKPEPVVESGSDLPDATTAPTVDTATDDAGTPGAELGPEAAADGESMFGATDEGAAEMPWPEVDRRVRQIGRRSTDRDPNPATVAAVVARLQGGRTHRVNPLMAELSKAMHVAAAEARKETLEGLAADASARVEAIRTTSADEAAQLKQKADADIAAVREWSKAELSRIREETERRIGARRADLEREVSTHAGHVERRIERVRRTVAAFETEMAGFFEMLLAEQNPTRVALLAEQLPEPPSLELDDEMEDAYEELEASAMVSGGGDLLIGDSPATEATIVDDGMSDAALSPEGAAAAEAAAAALATIELDTATAEMNAPDAIPVPAEDADSVRTELVVTGLVSVASIAGFKRDVSRITGVKGVGVTSGPDGEFLFAVDHAANVDLKAAVTGLRGGGATITGEGDGIVHVSAPDRGPDA